jgi:hypothetical protein
VIRFLRWLGSLPPLGHLAFVLISLVLWLLILIHIGGAARKVAPRHVDYPLCTETVR